MTSEPEPKQVKHGNQSYSRPACRLPGEVVDFTAGQDCALRIGPGIGAAPRKTSTLLDLPQMSYASAPAFTEGQTARGRRRERENGGSSSGLTSNVHSCF